MQSLHLNPNTQNQDYKIQLKEQQERAGHEITFLLDHYYLKQKKLTGKFQKPNECVKDGSGPIKAMPRAVLQGRKLNCRAKLFLPLEFAIETIYFPLQCV